MPAMGHDMDGFNITNDSTASCSLSAFPSSLALATSSGTPLPPVSLPSPSGAPTTDDFVNYSPSVPVAIAPGLLPSTPTPIVLSPGEKVVEVLFTMEPIGQTTSNAACLVAPSGGQLSVSLAGTTLRVPIPTTPLLKSTLNPAGSAFLSCAVVTVSPFLTWPEAVSIVGPPTPQPTQGTAAPLVDQSIYSPAP